LINYFTYDDYFNQNERAPTKPGQWGYEAPKKSKRSSVVMSAHKYDFQCEEEDHTKNERIPTKPSQWGYVAPRVMKPRSSVKMYASSVPTDEDYEEDYFNKNERTTKTEMKADASWDKAWRQPIVSGNWKSNGDRDFIESYPKNVLNKSKWDPLYMQVCVAPTDIHLSEVQKVVNSDINVMA